MHYCLYQDHPCKHYCLYPGPPLNALSVHFLFVPAISVPEVSSPGLYLPSLPYQHLHDVHHTCTAQLSSISAPEVNQQQCNHQALLLCRVKLSNEEVFSIYKRRQLPVRPRPLPAPCPPRLPGVRPGGDQPQRGED